MIPYTSDRLRPDPQPARLGREKRLEQPGAHLGRHAAAVVPHPQLDEPARPRLQVGGALFRPDDAVGQSQRKHTAAGHGVTGIDRQGVNRLVQLRPVAEDRPHVAVRPPFDANRGRQLRLQQPHLLREQLIQVQGLAHADAAAAERQQSGGHGRAALGGFLGRRRPGSEVAQDLLIRGRAQVLQNQIHISDDGGQLIVEVVGDAADEGRQHLQFLGLAHLLLQPPSFGDVHQDAGVVAPPRRRRCAPPPAPPAPRRRLRPCADTAFRARIGRRWDWEAAGACGECRRRDRPGATGRTGAGRTAGRVRSRASVPGRDWPGR